MNTALAVTFATFLLAEPNNNYVPVGTPIAVNPHTVKHFRPTPCDKATPYEKCVYIVYENGSSHIVAGTFEEALSKMSGTPASR